MQEKQSLKKGFTLIELSVVLIIMGLLVTSITVGRELIKASQRRNVIREVGQIRGAISTFQLQYQALPGDMPDAFDVWGTNCAPAAASCNGDGNGRIEHTASLTDNEGLNAWRHLSLAELIKGSYTGETTAAGYIIPGVNAYQSKLGDAAAYWFNYLKVNAGFDNDRPSNKMALGQEIEDAEATAALLTPAEAQDINLKIDNGLPDSGTVFSVPGDGFAVGTECITGAGASWNYLLTDQNVTCIMYFSID